MTRVLARHHSLRGVRVVPVVRGRIAFAQAVLDAIEAEQPNFVATDLPGFLNGSEWFETILSRLPLATSVVMKRTADCLMLPFTPSDACTMAAWSAHRRHIPHECVDNFTYIAKQSDRIFGPRSGIPATVPTADLPAYFEAAWRDMNLACARSWSARTGLARGAGIAHELERISREHRRVLFVADYRTWWAVRKFLNRPSRIVPPPLRGELPAVLLFEDVLALWHAGLCEMPHLVGEFFRATDAGESFDAGAAVARALGGHAAIARGLHAETRTSSAVLDAIEERAGSAAAAEAASRLLRYRAPTCEDAANLVPAFATITAGGIGHRYWMFDPPDVFEATPLYEPSAAETAAFFPDAERSNRAGWGPDPLPYVTRAEGARFVPSPNNRWSIDGNAVRIAEAAAMARGHVAGFRFDPPLSAPPDVFTPVVFVWSNESDGDVRSVDDCNLTLRRLESGEIPGNQPLPAGCPAPDVIHTICATRSVNAAWWGSLVQYDIATSYATLYTGPEIGPARYEIMTAHHPAERICRENPAGDPALAGFSKDQVAAAFAVQWARELVIVIAHGGWKPSQALLDLAKSRAVHLVAIPLSVIPVTTHVRLRRRVFVDKNIRMDRGAGRRLENRFAEWRLQPNAANFSHSRTPA
jgi:hypothetical protein